MFKNKIIPHQSFPINTEKKEIETKEILIDTTKKEENNAFKTPEKKDIKKNDIKKKEEEMEEEDEKIFNENPLRINIEKELEKIELKNQIVIRLLENEGKKYIDFCKFYKGYPTKKNIKIEYDIYKKINEYLNKIYN